MTYSSIFFRHTENPCTQRRGLFSGKLFIKRHFSHENILQISKEEECTMYKESTTEQRKTERRAFYRIRDKEIYGMMVLWNPKRPTKKSFK